MVFPSLFSTYLIHLFSSLTMPSNAHWPWMQGESLRIILFWSLMGWYACKFLILNDITCEKWMKWTDIGFLFGKLSGLWAKFEQLSVVISLISRIISHICSSTCLFYFILYVQVRRNLEQAKTILEALIKVGFFLMKTQWIYGKMQVIDFSY